MTHPVPEEPHIKITMQMMYREQQETNKLLARTVAHLENLQDIPERVRALELKMSTTAQTAEDLKKAQDRARNSMFAAILSIGTALISFFR